MDKKVFIAQVVDQFEDVDVAEISELTPLREIKGWSSFAALSIMAMIKSNYDVAVSAKQMREVSTIGDLYSVVNELLGL